MPTPRLSAALSRPSRAPRGASGGAWVPGTVVSAGGSINAVYRVALDGGETVEARSSLDFPIVEGSAVYVVRVGSGHVVAGMR